ncbi:hypothetical protein [Streptomyces sp. CA-253872]|uniref:hypothetical protein n=1 Tax=Streptomyces sp. CA-253872 TaxID=3240067 RepID=UPI003D8ECCD4
MDRDGATVTEADVLLEVEWARVLDDTSTARILVQPDGDCCAAFARVRSWRHQLHIYRDDTPVWMGPIVTPEWRATGGVEIQAVDVLGWLDRRVPHQSLAFEDTDLEVIARWLIEDGFAPDDPGHEVQVIGPTRIRGARAYQEDVGQTGDHLRELAATGLDYTAIGSRIVLLPESHCARVGSLTDADFPAGLTITEDGASLATRYIVHGRDSENGQPPVVGSAGGGHPYYGLLERSVEESSVLDNASATAAARSRLGALLPAPTFIDTSQETTLAPDAAVDVEQLVPGWCVDVTTTSTCRDISQRLKIQGVKVKETADGESVSVQLAPSGV